MNMYSGYSFPGMNYIWWIFWIGLLFWNFIIPYSIQGERRKANSPIDILKKRFATAEITKEQFLEHKTY